MPTGIYPRTEKHWAQIRRDLARPGLVPHNKGMKMGIEHRKKLSVAHIGQKLSEKAIELNRKRWSGDGNPNWKGGITKSSGYNQVKCNERRARKLGAGTHALKEWEKLKEEYNFTCPSCGKKEPEIKLTEDHIKALICGGSNKIENIQPLCKSCNSKKHTKEIMFDYWSPIKAVIRREWESKATELTEEEYYRQRMGGLMAAIIDGRI